jgi:hypothetical protein
MRNEKLEMRVEVSECQVYRQFHKSLSLYVRNEREGSKCNPAHSARLTNCADRAPTRRTPLRYSSFLISHFSPVLLLTLPVFIYIRFPYTKNHHTDRR